MKLSDIYFDLPKNLIAKHPTEQRDESRLMVLHRDKKKIEHKTFKDILKYFNEGDTMVLNNTQVFPARLRGNKEKTGSMIEVFLLRELNAEQMLWDVIVDPARKIRIGNKLYFFGNDKKSELSAEVIDNTTSRGRTIRFAFNGTPEELKRKLYAMGETPIPKYLGREAEKYDVERFQSVHAKYEGAVIAPSSNLHFTKNLLKKFEIKGVNLSEITVHINLSCFYPIEVEDLNKHRLGAEEYIIEETASKIINDTLEAKKQVCAVGTATAKILETAVNAYDKVKPGAGWSNKFIHPPHEYKIPSMLLTNFHLPGSVALVNTATFGGMDFVMKAYQEAIKEKYRFLTYGDAMLIL